MAEAYAVKLCKVEKCPAALGVWRSAGANVSIGSGPYPSGSTWGLSITYSQAGTVAGETRCDGERCYCRMVSVNGDSACAGGWVYDQDYTSGNPYGIYCWNNCAPGCLSCARNGLNGSCTRSALFEPAAGATHATCPIAGVCTDADFKTVSDGDSCGSGYVETTYPTLSISTTGTDSKGAYGYSCVK